MKSIIPLKADGTLDIECINQQPLEEYMDTISSLNCSQLEEYLSKLPIDESNEPMKAVKVDYSRDDERSGIDIDEYIKKWKEDLDER